MYGMDQGSWMLGGGWMMLGWLWMALIWIVPLVILFALGKYVFGGSKSRPGPVETKRTALDILDEAYARGEVGREDYLQKREDLQKHSM